MCFLDGGHEIKQFDLTAYGLLHAVCAFGRAIQPLLN